MGATGHLSVQQGKKVIVHMKSGSKYIGKFKSKNHTYITIQNDGFDEWKLPTQDIRTISIYKPIS